MSNGLKQRVVRFFNAYGLKEYYMLLKYNKISFGKAKEPMLVAVVDHRRHCQGLADRFKGIVTVYALAKAINVPFRCVFTHPFHLKDFLEPNTYNWLPQPEELSNNIRDARFKIMRKQPTLERLFKVLPLKKQVFVYANYDYLGEINEKYNKNYEWGVLFNELFKPTKELEDNLQIHLKQIGDQGYLACTFRFQALLADFKDDYSMALTDAEKTKLIETNRNALSHLVDNTDLPVLVSSDSMTFIDAVKTLDRVYTVPGKVAHIDRVGGDMKGIHMKLLLDFFMLSRAKKVFSIGTDSMYLSNFPVYAAKINDIPFERIKL